MFEFLQKFKQLVCEQEYEIERALIGHGKYEHRPQYLSFHVPEVKHLKKFSNTSVTDISPSSVLVQCSGLNSGEGFCRVPHPWLSTFMMWPILCISR